MKYKLTINRPMRTAKNRRTSEILLRIFITKQNVLKIERAAVLCGMTISAFMRDVSLAAYSQLLPEIREHKEEIDALIRRRRIKRGRNPNLDAETD